MWRFLTLLFLLCSPAIAQTNGTSPPDPFKLTEMPDDGLRSYVSFQSTSGLTIRDQTINPAKKTLVLICAGQSQFQNITPTLYVPTHSSVIDNFNIYDGASYSINGPLLGTPYGPLASGQGPGNICARLADLFVTNAIFDRVVIVPVAIGGTAIASWDVGGPLYTRIGVAIKRLASRGMTPSTTGVTFAMTWGQGETDQSLGTSQAAYQASLANVISAANAAGFTGGRFFINLETWRAGLTSTAVRAAQSAVVNNTTVFAGGDLDTLNATNRNSDNTHFNDTGAAAAATLMYNAMHASGSPF